MTRPFVLLGVVGCGHGAVLSPETATPRCRELVAADSTGDLPSVRWFGPGQDDELIRHYQWCRATGPLLVFRPSKAAEPIDSLALVSFNVDLGAASAIQLIDSLRAGAFTAGHPVTQFVLLLQETFREGALVPSRVPNGGGAGRGRYPMPAAGERLDIVRIADSLGLHLFYVPAMRSGKGANPRGLSEDRGNAILATVSLRDLTMVELPFGGSRRVAHLATVTGRTAAGVSWRIQIANVHFDVGPIGPAALSAIRARQARAMALVVDSTGAVALGGDLNAFTLSGTAESVQILERALPDARRGDRLPTRGSQRLDYFFFRLPAGYSAPPYLTLPLDYLGSDHRPLIAWIRFGGP